MPIKRFLGAALAWVALSSVALAQETEENPSAAIRELADSGYSSEYGRPPAWHLADHNKLAASLAALQPERPGVVDAYVVVIGLDSDGVFSREATQGARVLQHRYDAAGRTILLTTGEGSTAPNGSPQNLATTIGAIATLMDSNEDVLILYTTSHGDADSGLAYRDEEVGNGMIGPGRLRAMLDDAGIARRMVIVSACYSGIFVPALKSETSIVITAASAETKSFGCAAENDWTFFGDALLNNAMRANDPLPVAARKAFGLITVWEKKVRIRASKPQLFIGEDATTWLAALEKRMPQSATAKVGRPALQTSR